MVTFKDTDHYKLHNLYPGQYCVDMAKMGEVLEGPLLIHCNSKKHSGKITKCCAKGKILSQDRKKCIPKRRHRRTFLPPRLIRDPKKYKSSDMHCL